MGRLGSEGGGKWLQDCLGRMEFDFWDVKSGDTPPTAGGSFELLASLLVRNYIL
jgi:hypothetical protein